MRALRSIAFLALVPLLGTSFAGENRPQVRDPRATNPTGDSSITGRVTTSEGRPLRRARVILRIMGPGAASSGGRGGPSNMWQTLSDDNGQFRFDALPAGTYNLTANHSAYLTAQYGQRFVGQSGRAIELGAKEAFRADLVSVRGGAITGRILDEHGEPMPDVGVELYRWVRDGERRTLQRTGGRVYPSNDLGQYRVSNLPPGDYYLAAQYYVTMESNLPVSGPRTGYALTWFPGVASPMQAQRIRIAPGQEAGNIDFLLHPTPLVSVSGRILRADGGAPERTNLFITSIDDIMNATMRAETRVMPDGSFTVSSIAPGDYYFNAFYTPSNPTIVRPGVENAPRRMPEMQYARARVTVSENMDTIVLQLQPGAKITARFEGAPASRMSFSLVPTEANRMNFGGGTMFEDGAYVTTVGPGKYRVAVFGGSDGAIVERVMHGGRDIRREELAVTGGEEIRLSIVLSQRGATLTGTASAGIQPVTDYTVVVMPAKPEDRISSLGMMRTARPDQYGRFTLASLLPGDYIVSAVDFVDMTQMYDPEMWKRLEAAGTRITMGPSEQKSVALPYTALTSGR